ncbi:hypothetical protein [Prescottella sp. R16]|uniref:hypothetical protein n=1 Tax=Prescottella sp. R16 TaxID=3064529 RepID=UPI00272E5373|nr:hypothetical protein [Prescottella sp. R16]
MSTVFSVPAFPSPPPALLTPPVLSDPRLSTAADTLSTAMTLGSLTGTIVGAAVGTSVGAFVGTVTVGGIALIEVSALLVRHAPVA